MAKQPDALTAVLARASAREPERQPEPPPPQSAKPPARAGKKLIAAHVPPKVWAALRIIGTEEEKTLQTILEEAIDLYLVKKGRGGMFRE